MYKFDDSNNTLEHVAECDHLGPITDCSFSPNGEYLVASDANRKVILYKVPEFNVSAIKCYKKNSIKYCNIVSIITLTLCYWIVGNYYKYNIIIFS